ncbi:hypothetical protein LTR37_016762 [Vermiconidia calcicola]|uniref:Uncharacterized protein n=1 Tax=Vermiconidia calcicola TaxID=1690605 RepID=A0ACC3MNJ7_9PEZI|nr:hypothetical protein LTR37_016762 [Vermiconidia calcicola]
MAGSCNTPEGPIFYVPPPARMVASSSKVPSFRGTPTDSQDISNQQGTTSTRRSKGKEPVHFQAEVDRREAARDAADPTFPSPSPTPGPSTLPVRKRKAAQAEPSPQVKRPRKQHPGRNKAYNDCGPLTREKRDQHLARIGEHWDIPYQQWMPKPMMPSKETKVKGGAVEKRPLHPRDWREDLLAELAFLSYVTRGRPADARKALSNAVKRKDRPYEAPNVRVDDVKCAIRLCEAKTDASTAEAGAATAAAQEHDNAAADDEQILYEMDADAQQGVLRGITPDLEVPPVIEPQTLRSPTMGREDVAIKRESSPVAGPSSRRDSGWSGYDNERAKIAERELFCRAKHAEAAAAAADYELIKEKNRVREMALQRGRSWQDAIILRGETGQ